MISAWQRLGISECGTTPAVTTAITSAIALRDKFELRPLHHILYDANQLKTYIASSSRSDVRSIAGLDITVQGSSECPRVNPDIFSHWGMARLRSDALHHTHFLADSL